MENENVIPRVGMGATVCLLTDRHACTVIDVSPSGKTVTVQYDNVTRTDDNGMSESQQYSYSRNPNGEIVKFTLRKNGSYVEKGKSGTTLRLGTRREYYDYSF